MLKLATEKKCVTLAADNGSFWFCYQWLERRRKFVRSVRFGDKPGNE